MRKIVVLIILILLLLTALVVGSISGNHSDKAELDNEEDKCKVQSGYTEKSWKEHLSHHPDIYKECLS
jgi:hypothetical protein